MPAEEGKHLRYIFIDKIEILEEGKHTDITNQTDNEPKALHTFRGGAFNSNGSTIVNKDEDNKNEEIGWIKVHVEIATGGQQQNPTVFCGCDKIKQGNNKEEYQECYGTKNHCIKAKFAEY